MFSAAEREKQPFCLRGEKILQHIDIQKMQWFQNEYRTVNKNKAKDIQTKLE